MAKANEIQGDFKFPEGVHVLSEASYRKHVHSLPLRTCEGCGKRHGEGGVDVKRCQGCWSVVFCSTECQKRLWPQHKDHCKTLSTVLTLEELSRNFYSSPFLLHYLRVALILKLGLLSPPTFPGLPPRTKAFPSIIVHIHMHPISTDHEMAIYTGEISISPSDKDKVPGYLTVGISNEPVSYIPIPTSGGGGSKSQRKDNNEEYSMMLRSYKQARRDADAHGREANPIVMVDFGYDQQLINVGIELTPDSFETARGGAPPEFAALPEGIEPLPETFDVQAILRIANKYVELDKEDRLKLRRDLRKIDKAFLYRKAQYLVFGIGPPSFDGNI